MPVTVAYFAASASVVSACPHPNCHAVEQLSAMVDSCKYLVKKLVVDEPLSRWKTVISASTVARAAQNRLDEQKHEA